MLLSSRRTLTAAVIAATGLSPFAAVGAPALAAALPAAIPDVVGHVSHPFATPPTTASCETMFQIACYSPLQLETAYELPSVYADGTTGAGETVAVIDSFGSPTIQKDLDVFDKTYGLPNSNLSIIQPSGAVPPYKANNLREGWAEETTLDVEYAHAMAPEANILLVETPVAETEGFTGLPEMMDAEQYVVKHHLADVISQSFGATVNTFPDPKSDLALLEYAFKAAAKAHIPVLASSGDDGVTDSVLHGSGLYPYRVTSWPDSDPLVTSVGGTMLALDATGRRTAPDVVWNDGYGAGGGGVSSVFARPSYQNGVKSVVGAKRGVPDVSLSAAVDGGVIVYLGIPGIAKGYYVFGGTSEASPVFAGIVALATQQAGHDLGPLNPKLYSLYASKGYGKSGLVDVTSGNNSYNGVTGYTAKAGYDLASGLGTVDGAKLVAALAK